MHKLYVQTDVRTQFVDITQRINTHIARSNPQSALCHVFVPHTTAGLMLNENSDPCVLADIREYLETIVPWCNNYSHYEGNSAAHIKASILGQQQLLPISEQRLVLGRWQALFLAEFDGPRQREIWLTLL